MADKLTSTQLRELLDLEATAVPGPVEYREQLRANMSMIATQKYVIAAIPNEKVLGEYALQRANANLFVASRNAIRPLVEELLELREWVGEWACKCHETECECSEIEKPEKAKHVQARKSSM